MRVAIAGFQHETNAFAPDAEKVRAAAEGVLARLLEVEPEFSNVLLSPREAVRVAMAPGAHPCTLRNLEYRKLRPGVRLEPCGPEHCAR